MSTTHLPPQTQLASSTSWRNAALQESTVRFRPGTVIAGPVGCFWPSSRVYLGQQPLIEFKGSEEEAEALVLTSQEGKKLEPLEVAQMYNRMAIRGLSAVEIGERIGKSDTHVSNMLEVHAIPDSLKKLIGSKQVSVFLAQDTYREHGTWAA